MHAHALTCVHVCAEDQVLHDIAVQEAAAGGYLKSKVAL